MTTKKFISEYISLVFYFDGDDYYVEDSLFNQECNNLLIDIAHMNSNICDDESQSYFEDSSDMYAELDYDTNLSVEETDDYIIVVLPTEELKIIVSRSLEISVKKLIRIIEILYDMDVFQNAYDRLTGVSE